MYVYTLSKSLHFYPCKVVPLRSKKYNRMIMKTDKPLILISNDDGVSAKGINVLVETLAGLGQIVVMAPDGPRSGASGAITSELPVRYYKVKEEKDLTVYKCSGTPVDCVKLAMFEFLPRCPDLVIGGINHGDNSAVNVHYSGTIEQRGRCRCCGGIHS